MNILLYSFFGIAGGQEMDHTFVKFVFYSSTNTVVTRIMILE